YAYRLKQIDNDGTYEYSNEIKVDLGMLTEFSLKQNYPNPFNPTTTIQYNIPIISFVKISVYDILGKEIKQLVNELRNPGHHEIIFEAKELACGIYYYTIRTGEFTQSKKMILLK
ncbi:MAG: T9SS type A sorting domain-containing protein, partial [Ignavibacteriaceae bacterium]|nr:T9SS type A sorting domain-containing protein [Ignavibacteriaceae bacterium]